MFTPTLKSSNNIDIKVIQEDKFNYMDDELSKPSVYYVVDPGLTKDSCNPNIDFKGKVIIIASPDDGHWGGSDFIKMRRSVGGTFLFLPVWSLNELINARQHFEYGLHEEDIISRYEDVGGISRYIFTDGATFSEVLRNQETEINGLSEVQVRQLALGDVATAQTLGKG